MKVSYWAAALLLASACGGSAAKEPPTPTETALQEGARKTSTDPQVNPDAAAMADFKGRVEGYVELHKQLAKGDAKLEKNSDPVQITNAKAALAAKIQAARANAKPGDFLTAKMRPVFRRLLAPELKGEEGRDTKAVLKDDAPPTSAIPFKVNAKYPENQPLPSVPANILLNLPELPAPLEYRIVGRNLILLDSASDLIVDYMLNVAPA
jgi:hypothetical protein